MIVEQAQKLTDHLCRQQIIKEEEKSIYYFCFEVMISTVYFWLIALALAVLSGQIVESALYLAAFTLMRSAAGGYHAASHWRCLTMSAVSMVIFFAVELMVPESWLVIVMPVLGLYTVYLIGRFAPIDHPNNPFTAEERQRNRRKSLLYLGLMSVCLVLLWAVGKTHLAFCLLLGLAQAAAALNIAILKHQGGENDEECLDESTGLIG